MFMHLIAKKRLTELKYFKSVNFMVTPCLNNIQHFNFQLTRTTLKT